MSGGTLLERREELGRNVSEGLVVNIIRQVAEGIKYLHNQNFVHFGK